MAGVAMQGYMLPCYGCAGLHDMPLWLEQDCIASKAASVSSRH